MAPLFMKHSATVLSLNQLVEDDACPGAGTGAGLKPTAPSSVLAPDACVHLIAGTPVAKYAFAMSSPRKVQVQKRTYSEDIRHVPSLDDTSSSGSGGNNGFVTVGDSDCEDSVACHNLRTASTAAAAAFGTAIHRSSSAVFPDGALADDGADSSNRSLLDQALLALWEDCSEQGLFRYDVTECATKLIPGQYGFIAQLNEGRASKKRPTEFRIDQVCQPFDDSKFNFKKAFMREVLFQFEPSCVVTDASGCVASDNNNHNNNHNNNNNNDHNNNNGTSASTVSATAVVSKVVDAAPANSSPNLVLINVSPIEYGHVLLCPRVLDCLPQLVDPGTVLLALRFAVESDNPYFRVGYNSLGAYATINHLHFQAYYLAAPFPCERAPCAAVKGLKRKRGNVRVTRMVNYPVNGFVLEVGDSLEELANVVGRACEVLQKRDVPHNLLITDSGSRVFLWPQCYAKKQAENLVPEDILATGVNPAVFEIAGHLVLKRAEDYDAMTQDLAWRMLAEVSLPEEEFIELAQICFA